LYDFDIDFSYLLCNRYAANVGPRILEFFESFLGVDYPLAKEDLSAIPDFGPGAMENWGHIDFRWVRISIFIAFLVT
jgi:aminopeptidase N